MPAPQLNEENEENEKNEENVVNAANAVKAANRVNTPSTAHLPQRAFCFYTAVAGDLAAASAIVKLSMSGTIHSGATQS
jgi:hypothetical protein